MLQGKGFFIIDLPKCEDGDPAAILEAALEAGITDLIIRVADGYQIFGGDVPGTENMARVIQALQSGMIAIWGSQTIHTSDISLQAAAAIRLAQSLPLDGLVVCADHEFTGQGAETPARQFMTAIHSSLKIPLALSSYRFPNYHPDFPWSTFLEFCDYHMPQVIWDQSHDAGSQLRESKRQCDALPNARPFIPIGSASPSEDWNPSVDEIGDFLDTAISLDLPAVIFTDWENCRSKLPEVWRWISGFPWPVPSSAAVSNRPGLSQNSVMTIDSQDEFLKTFIEALNSRQAGRISQLYADGAIQVWSDQILKGSTAIRTGYEGFFDNLASDMPFQLTESHLNSDTLSFVWKADTLSGDVTLVVKNGKIILDYSFIS